VGAIIGVSGTSAVVAFVKERIEEKKEDPLDTELAHRKGFYERFLKRPQDCFLATGAALVFSPILGGTALIVKLKLGTPVLFTQERPGKNGKIFKLYKFRTMTDARDADGNLMPDEVRLTSFGKKLRSSSLDELPELINIIKGDMAVVGPRPLLVQYLPLYNADQARRHEVKPGLTGYAQSNGRNAITWEDKFNKDVYYVDHVGFLMDWSIVLHTFTLVLRRENINSNSAVTCCEYKGSK